MTIPRILLLGKSGQLGWALQRALLIHGELIAFDRTMCDLACLDPLEAAVRSVRPDVIVNAAAYTAVDKAETEPDLVHRINAEAAGVLAEEAKKAGALLVHYSTDYVFDGEKTSSYVETDRPNPINVYGRSKLAGEQAIAARGGAFLTFRTSWVYGSHGKNFPKTILAAARKHDRLRVVADQFGAPTSVDLIADVTSHCISVWLRDRETVEQAAGVYHLVPSGSTSWHGLARELVGLAIAAGMPTRVATDRIDPIVSAEYPTPARRPANSRLSSRKLEATFGFVLPPWQRQIARLIDEFATNGVWQ